MEVCNRFTLLFAADEDECSYACESTYIFDDERYYTDRSANDRDLRNCRSSCTGDDCLDTCDDLYLVPSICTSMCASREATTAYAYNLCINTCLDNI